VARDARAPMMLAVLAIQAAVLAGPQPVVAGDWLVVCDDRRRCTALSQVPAGEAADAYPLAVVRREGTLATIDIPIAAAVASGTRLSVKVDGRTIAQMVAPGGGAGLSLPFAGKLASALRRGRAMTIAAPGGRVQGRISLAGLGAAWTAIERAPTMPAPATIALPAADPRPPSRLSRKRLEKLAGKPPKGCAPPAARGYRLDAGHTLLEVTPPCAAAASPYILPDKGDPQAAAFDPPVAPGGAWDPAERRYRTLLAPLTERDCGTRRAYAWDGARFRLAEERLVAECRRATHEIVTYRADVR